MSIILDPRLMIPLTAKVQSSERRPTYLFGSQFRECFRAALDNRAPRLCRSLDIYIEAEDADTQRELIAQIEGDFNVESRVYKRYAGCDINGQPIPNTFSFHFILARRMGVLFELHVGGSKARQILLSEHLLDSQNCFVRLADSSHSETIAGIFSAGTVSDALIERITCFGSCNMGSLSRLRADSCDLIDESRWWQTISNMPGRVMRLLYDYAKADLDSNLPKDYFRVWTIVPRSDYIEIMFNDLARRYFNLLIENYHSGSFPMFYRQCRTAWKRSDPYWESKLGRAKLFHPSPHSAPRPDDRLVGSDVCDTTV